jgi:hypothetical protein
MLFGPGSKVPIAPVVHGFARYKPQYANSFCCIIISDILF